MDRGTSKEIIEFTRPSSLPGLELLVAKHSLRKWHMFHERYAICACQSAAAGWRYRGGDYFSGDGSVMLLEPGEVHRNTRIHKLSQFSVLFVDAQTLQDAAYEMGLSGTPHFRLAECNDRELFAALCRVSAAVQDGASSLEQQSRLALCTRLLFGFAERAPRPPAAVKGYLAVARAKDYIRARFHESLSLDDVAGIAGLSRFHLVRTFAKHVGVPPHGYQIHVRIEHAAALLRAGLPLTAVGEAVGFADQSHFTRHFKRIMHVTPGGYARGRAVLQDHHRRS